MTTVPYGAGSMTLSYDSENRVIHGANSNWKERCDYSPDNRRVYQKVPADTELTPFYGVNGDRRQTYSLGTSTDFTVAKTNIYFAGRLVRQNNVAAFIDGLGQTTKGRGISPTLKNPRQQRTITTNLRITAEIPELAWSTPGISLLRFFSGNVHDAGSIRSECKAGKPRKLESVRVRRRRSGQFHRSFISSSSKTLNSARKDRTRRPI